MQTACYWQFCFSDRFTGARNPTRLPITIQSRRNRCAPKVADYSLHPGYFDAVTLIFDARQVRMDTMSSKLVIEFLAVAACVALAARGHRLRWPMRALAH